MSDTLGDLGNRSLFKLIGDLFKRVIGFVALERDFVKQETTKQIKSSIPWGIIAIVGLILLSLGGLCLLATIILLLNTWFMPWASALIVTIVLLVIGGVAGLIGLVRTKRGIEQAKATFNSVGEDIKWLREK
ncbi:MAG: phage holin family protein [Thermodesulfobacteriota bacterium]|nr:phage holin family protein [Thermodesulfobacteriota bacterium]